MCWLESMLTGAWMADGIFEPFELLSNALFAYYVLLIGACQVIPGTLRYNSRYALDSYKLVELRRTTSVFP